MEAETPIIEDGEILEEDDNNINQEPIADQDQFLRSRVFSREPQTICSEESSNDNSDNSDDDSDYQCSKPKIVKPEAQLPNKRKEVPSKYKVWSIALQEEALTENLIKCDVEAIDRERSVESYNYKIAESTDFSQFSGYHMPVSECHFIDSDYIRGNDEEQSVVGSKRRRAQIKKRLGKRGDRLQPHRLPHLAVTADNSVEEVAEDIASKLKERKSDLILNVVLVLGKEKAIALYNETKGVEDNGGMFCMNGERRRTSGGVYLLLLKRDDTITSDEMKDIFTEDSNQCKHQRKKIAKRRRQRRAEEIKETLIREKLLCLNTAVGAQDSETKSLDVPVEAESSNNLEDGEVEINVSNPPPSPATDQDTPPSRVATLSEDEVAHSVSRKSVSYEDYDDDVLDFEVDEMDLF